MSYNSINVCVKIIFELLPLQYLNSWKNPGYPLFSLTAAVSAVLRTDICPITERALQLE